MSTSKKIVGLLGGCGLMLRNKSKKQIFLTAPPSQTKNDDCLRYSKTRIYTSESELKWNDWRCDHKHKFVCNQKLCAGEKLIMSDVL